VYVLNRHRQIIKGIVTQRIECIDVNLPNNSGRCLHNVVTITKSGAAETITECGDSGSIVMLPPERGDRVVHVIGMVVGILSHPYNGESATIVVDLPLILDRIVNDVHYLGELLGQKVVCDYIGPDDH